MFRTFLEHSKHLELFWSVYWTCHVTTC